VLNRPKEKNRWGEKDASAKYTDERKKQPTRQKEEKKNPYHLKDRLEKMISRGGGEKKRGGKREREKSIIELLQ